MNSASLTTPTKQPILNARLTEISLRTEEDVFSNLYFGVNLLLGGVEE